MAEATQWVMVQKAAIDWLMGEGPDPSGFHFGDFPDDLPPVGAFWWRQQFQAMLAAASPPPPSVPVGVTDEMISRGQSVVEAHYERALHQWEATAFAEGCRAVFALATTFNALRTAAEGIADDYMTSESHHPGYVLIPTAKFEAIRSALTSSTRLIEPVTLGLLEAKAIDQKAYWERRQADLPCIEDLTDDEGVFTIPDDPTPLFNFFSANGRYSEADWWLGTIRAAISTAAPKTEAVEACEADVINFPET